MQDWPSHLWYESVYLFTHMACTFGASLRTEGRQNIPRTGPVLIIANHQSFVDPVLVGLSTRRHLWYLARKSLFRNPVMASLSKSVPSPVSTRPTVGFEDVLRSLESHGRRVDTAFLGSVYDFSARMHADQVLPRERDHLARAADLGDDGRPVRRAVASPLPERLARVGIECGERAVVASADVRDQNAPVVERRL